MIIKTYSENFIRIHKHEFVYGEGESKKTYTIDCSVFKHSDGKLYFGYAPKKNEPFDPLKNKFHIWVGEVNKENKNIRAPKEVYGAAIELFKKFGKELGYEEGNLVFAETQ